MEGFVRAHMVKSVSEMPRYLLQMWMDLEEFDNCIQDGTIEIYPSMYTVVLMQDAVPENYATIQYQVMGTSPDILDGAFHELYAEVAAKTTRAAAAQTAEVQRRQSANMMRLIQMRRIQR